MEEQIEEIGKRTNSFLTKISDPDLWINYGFIAVKIFIILLLATFVIRVGNAAIRNVFKRRTRAPLQLSERREATLVKLLQNILTYSVYFITIVMILSSLTIDVTGIIAGAGIIGLAVGFGAQNLVKDVISGFFIIFEDQFSVGDYVKIGQFEGTVDEIGLRTTKILNWTGELYILQNGNITEVTNYSIHNSLAVVDVGISYYGDIQKAERVIEDVLEKMPEQYEQIVGEPSILGVQQLGREEVVLRIIAETLPVQNWYIAREIRKQLKLAFEANGIDIPYQRIMMFTDENLERNERVHDRQGG